MAQNPEDRYASPIALSSDIEAWARGDGVSVHTASLRVRTHRWIRDNSERVAALAAAVIVTFVAVAIGFWIVSGKNKELEQQNFRLLAANQSERKSTEQAKEQSRLASEVVSSLLKEIQPALRRQSGSAEARIALLSGLLPRIKRLSEVHLSAVDRGTAELTALVAIAELMQEVGASLSQDASQHPDQVADWMQESLAIAKNAERLAKDLVVHRRELVPQLMTAQNTLAATFRQHGDADSAKRLYQETIGLGQDMSSGATASPHANACRSLSQIFLLQGELVEALSFAAQAVELSESIGGLEHASSIRSLAAVQHQAGSIQTAQDNYESARHLLSDLAAAAPNDLFVQQGLLAVGTDLAACASTNHDFASAEKGFSDGLAALHRLQSASESPMPLELRTNEAKLRRQIGLNWLLRADHEMARRQFEDSIRLLEELAKDGRLAGRYKALQANVQSLVAFTKDIDRAIDDSVDVAAMERDGAVAHLEIRCVELARRGKYEASIDAVAQLTALGSLKPSTEFEILRAEGLILQSIPKAEQVRGQDREQILEQALARLLRIAKSGDIKKSTIKVTAELHALRGYPRFQQAVDTAP